MYTFRFETVLRYRRQVEDQKQKAMADVQRALLAEFTKLKLIESNRSECLEMLRNRQRNGISIRELSLYENYLHRVELEKEAQRKTIRQLNHDVEEKRKELLEASKKKRILETLQENEEKDYQKEMLHKEQRLNDEIAVNKYARALRFQHAQEGQTESDKKEV